jgi:hypothetical protein
MESEQFLSWFQNVFLKYTNDCTGTRVLFVDGHNSHISVKVVELAVQNRVEIICLQAHSSHLLQPLDVGVYSHVKRVWKSILNKHYSNSHLSVIDKQEFNGLLATLYADETVFAQKHAIAGFEESGLYPLNPKKVNKELADLRTSFRYSEEIVFEPSSSSNKNNSAPETNVASNSNRICLRSSKSPSSQATSTQASSSKSH